MVGCLLGSSRRLHALEQDKAAKIDIDTDRQRARTCAICQWMSPSRESDLTSLLRQRRDVSAGKQEAGKERAEARRFDRRETN